MLLVVPPLALLQPAAMALPVDLGTVLWGGLIALLTSLVGLVSWFLRRMVDRNDASNAEVKTEVKTSVGALSAKVDQTAEGLRAIRQELVGMDGRNGMKGKQRDMERRMNRDSVVLQRLAFKVGVEVPELAEEE